MLGSRKRTEENIPAKVEVRRSTVVFGEESVAGEIEMQICVEQT